MMILVMIQVAAEEEAEAEVRVEVKGEGIVPMHLRKTKLRQELPSCLLAKYRVLESFAWR